MTDRVDQLSDGLRQLAAESEGHQARLVALQARIGALEEHLAAGQAAQSRTAERLEQLAVTLDASAALDSLAAQVAAARAAQSDTATRVERLAADLTAIGRVEASLGQLRREVLEQLDGRERALRGEVGEIDARLGRDATQLGRELRALGERVEAWSGLSDRLAAMDRRQQEQLEAHARLEARVEAVAAERATLTEALHRVEKQVGVRLDDLAERVGGLGAEIGAWRARIEAQSETVRDAHAVAAEMRAEAVRMREAHHATAEAQRIAEGRTNATLEVMRQEMDQVWAHFLQERARVWSDLKADNDDRDEHLARLDGQERDLSAQMEALDRRLGERIAGLSEALLDLRRDVTAALAHGRTAAEAAVAEVEGALPSGERSTETVERRQAVRRALRARHGPPPG